MPIRLTAIGGPLDGQVFEFAKGKAAITIGRLEDRDIRFPPDFRSVSRAHLAIVSEGDKYFLRPDEPVFVDGEEAMRDDELPRRCELRLGTRNGPGFKVEWSVLSDMPSTQPPWKRRETSARAAMRSMARVRILATAALLAAAGVTAYLLLQPEPILDRLTAARSSVYVVMHVIENREIANGTAWVIGPGTLATAGHVIPSVEEAKKYGGKTFVRSNVPPYETHEVVSAQMHPNYLMFTIAVRLYAPVAAGGRLVEWAGGYDVGLLRVSPTAKIAAPLKLAPSDALHRLAAGDEVGYIGYPAEKMLFGGVNIAAPTPQMHIARITAVTDFFMEPGTPAERYLIQNSLPATGGASGSPVFNRRGEVIGIFTNANLYGQARLPGVLINFAQRVDLVSELFDPKVETIAAAREKEWEKRLLAMPSYPNWLVQEFQEQTQTKGAKPALQKALVLETKPEFKEPVAVTEYEVPGPGSLLILTVGDFPLPLALTVLDRADGDKELTRKGGETHYPWANLEPSKAGKIAIAVTGQSAGLKAALVVYFVPKKP